MIPLAIALGAAVGAPVRYLTERAVQRRWASPLPVGTLLVNVVASLVLGAVAGAQPSGDVQALLATGFCGALSTFSTFSYQVERLTRTGRPLVALGYVLVSVLAGLGAASLGWLLAT